MGTDPARHYPSSQELASSFYRQVNRGNMEGILSREFGSGVSVSEATHWESDEPTAQLPEGVTDNSRLAVSLTKKAIAYLRKPLGKQKMEAFRDVLSALEVGSSIFAGGVSLSLDRIGLSLVLNVNGTRYLAPSKHDFLQRANILYRQITADIQ